jgi:cytochrome c5
MRSTMLSDTPRRPPCRARFLPAVFAAAIALAGPALAADRTAVEVVNGQCAKCHQPGTANAPKIGDKAAWVQRLKLGVDPLVYSAIRGHGGMPPRGGRADLTDSELRAAILYMYDPAGPPKDLPKSTAMPILPGAGPHRASAGGLDIYFGRVSAERLRAYPANSAEAKIHGGIPSGSGYHHVNISLFEAGTQTPVTGASVVLEVEKTGMGRESKALEAVTVAGGTSYGGYVRLAPKSDYAFIAKVSRPGAPPVEVRFREKID